MVGTTLVDRNIDIVFCIDATGSMAPCIDSIKANARRFHKEFVKKMTDLNSSITSMRIKLIAFRDYGEDGADAMSESRFFEFPDDQADFENCLAGITATGGGDDPENGLEALYCAMRSDFVTGTKDRQVIVLFSDADALPLGARAGSQDYPADMVDDDGFFNTWMCCSGQSAGLKLRERSKRLVLFAPKNSQYEKISTKLNRSIFSPVTMDAGLGDIDFDDIIEIIAATASGV